MKTETGGSGLSINKIFVAEDMKLHEEWYLAMTFDRENYCPVIIVRRNDGADVGSIPTNKTQKFHTIKFALTKGVTPDVVDKVSDVMKNSSTEAQNLQTLLNGLYKIFTSKDATLLEVNSLVKSADGTFTCLNTKSTFDDASAKRQKDLFALRDSDHEVPEEVEAEKYGLVYVRMDGNIGNVVNGAGLAMATNDAIALHGGTSANFLDAGGQATKETMVKAFEIILRDTRVKAILVNIYGGITRGDMIAESIIGAATELGPLKVPMVVRLQGTNSELGLKLLEEANLGLHTEADFGRAAQKAVELAK
ncbi:succinyl-ligase [Colletotrichum truncatum]|uniref:Succinyl-ligase n=1 Tax=Colletotrichum truncatum TaxID=5467 RepID=A0ACC3ZFP7_COLTU